MSRLRMSGKVEVYASRADRIVYPHELRRLLRDGTLRRLVETRNLVTDVGLAAMMALLGGGHGVHDVGGSGYGPGNFTDLVVTTMALSDGASPPVPSPSDTALNGALAYDFDLGYPVSGNQLLTSVQVGPGQIRFSGMVQPQHIAGTIFTEEGLFTASGKLVARTTFSVLKEANVGLQVDHTLMLSRA